MAPLFKWRVGLVYFYWNAESFPGHIAVRIKIILSPFTRTEQFCSPAQVTSIWHKMNGSC